MSFLVFHSLCFLHSLRLGGCDGRQSQIAKTGDMFWAEVQAPCYFSIPSLPAQSHNLAGWRTHSLLLLHLASCPWRSFISERNGFIAPLHSSNGSSSPLCFKFSELSLGIQGFPYVSSLRAFVPGSFAKDMVVVCFLAHVSVILCWFL